MKNDKRQRKCGLLLHISSLNGPEGIGTFGAEAYNFVDKLSEAKQRIWQILPLGHTGFSNSPYASFSAFAGNPFFIDTRKLSAFLEKKLVLEAQNIGKADFVFLKEKKMPILKTAAEIFIERNNFDEFRAFEKQNMFWLHDYAVFITIKQQYNCMLIQEMPVEIIERDKKVLSDIEDKFEKEILKNKIIQFFFYRQWNDLKNYANSKGIEIFGDLPLYVAPDSADLWAHKENFAVRNNLCPIKIAGVPPDYFSSTGQLWGNPVYDWEYLKMTNFAWWVERLKQNTQIYDILRIDHFRGLVKFWSVDYGQENAVNGHWNNVPSVEFFDEIYKNIPDANFVAEDLGLITEDVTKLRKKYSMPGMKVLQFAYNSDPRNSFLTHNFSRNYVAYTGTHDNNTMRAWYIAENDEIRDRAKKYLTIDENNIGFSFVKHLWASVADTVIAPVQDILDLDADARMNIPGTDKGNWAWRINESGISDEILLNLKNITELFARDN